MGLAQRVYDVAEPTAAQLSAVRRAAARLVASGKAVRDTDRRSISFDRHGRTSGTHWRRSFRGSYETSVFYNPGGVAISRPMRDDDKEARKVVLSRLGFTGEP